VLIHYIAPTVWAWGKGRIKKMEKTLDLLLTIYPFEPPLFSASSLDVKFVGHPLMQKLQVEKKHLDWKPLFGMDESATLIALFPGSREGEIKRNLPPMLEAIKLLPESMSFALSLSSEQDRALVEEEVAKHGVIDENNGDRICG
jgi:lipid-A-disaccharide synthase